MANFAAGITSRELRARRRQMHITQAQLARLAHLKFSTVWRIENEVGRIKSEHLIALAEALEVEAKRLVSTAPEAT